MDEIDYLVVGGGLSGIFSGLYLKKIFPEAKVLVVELSASCGGLLNKLLSPEGAVFDYGIHTFQETGDPRVDDIILGDLIDNKWNNLGDVTGDLSGTFRNGKVYSETSFVDLTDEPDIEYIKKSIGESFGSCESNDLKSYLIDRYGQYTYDNHLADIVENVFKKNAAELSCMAANLLPLFRISVLKRDDFTATPSLIDNQNIAFYDQRKLPLEYHSGRCSFYPEKYGIFSLIEALEFSFKSKGGEISLSTKVEDIHVTNNTISKVTLDTPNGIKDLFVREKVIWSAGLPSLSRIIPGVDFLKGDSPFYTLNVSLLIDGNFTIEDIHYLYNLDLNPIFRVSFPKNFCKKSTYKGLERVNIEAFSDSSINETDLKEEIINSFLEMNVLSPESKIVESFISVCPGGFPQPTLVNESSVNNLRYQIMRNKPENMMVVGRDSSEHCFFQGEILLDVVRKIDEEFL